MYVLLHMCSNVNSRVMINKHYRWRTGSELTFHVEAKSYKRVFSEDQVSCMNCRGVQGNTIHWSGKVRNRGEITAGPMLQDLQLKTGQDAIIQMGRCST